MILPHNPFDVTPDSDDPQSTDSKQNFIDMVQYIDKNVGRLEDTLTSLGLREQTLILFTSDNGTNAQLTSELDGSGNSGWQRLHTRLRHACAAHCELAWIGFKAERVMKDLICFLRYISNNRRGSAGLPKKQIEDGDGWSFWPQCEGKPGRTT